MSQSQLFRIKLLLRESIFLMMITKRWVNDKEITQITENELLKVVLKKGKRREDETKPRKIDDAIRNVKMDPEAN